MRENLAYLFCKSIPLLQRTSSIYFGSVCDLWRQPCCRKSQDCMTTRSYTVGEWVIVVFLTFLYFRTISCSNVLRCQTFQYKHGLQDRRILWGSNWNFECNNFIFLCKILKQLTFKSLFPANKQFYELQHL